MKQETTKSTKNGYTDNTVYPFYGAVGDGITDCTTAIQKALDDASVCHGKVEVPPGKYSVGKLHMHGQGVSLVGTSACHSAVMVPLFLY